MDNAAGGSDDGRIHADDLRDLERDFNLDRAFPKPKVDECCVWRIRVRSFASEGGAFIAELTMDPAQNNAPAETQQLPLFGFQIPPPMVIDIHREALAIVEQPVAES